MPSRRVSTAYFYQEGFLPHEMGEQPTSSQTKFKIS